MLDYVAQYEKNIAILKGPDPLDALNIPEEHNFNIITVPAAYIVQDGYSVPPNAVAIVKEDMSEEVEHVFAFASTLYKPLLRRKIVELGKHAIWESGIDTRDMTSTHRFSKNSAKWQWDVKFPRVTIEPAVGDIT